MLAPAARRDRREIERWYRALLAVIRLREELEAALRYVAKYPLGSRVLDGRYRGKTLLHFPYTIVYLVLSDRVRILAIADERRHPEYYADRFR